MINSELKLDLRWTRSCIISEISRTPEVYRDNPAEATTATSELIEINNATLYIPVVTLSVTHNMNFLERLIQGFKRTISWNKYRSEIRTEPKNNNLDYMIDPTFRNINRLFILSIKDGYDNPTRNSFDDYYMPLVEIKILMC